MSLRNLVGQTLDKKYKVERELGRGGMGAVYFATHIGTERPVALKVIVPQFMQRREFVERFKREARAAGRLRHPNVVDVTDFGFAETDEGRVAYLVMEYLDGCTLGEILEEEKKLPLTFALDILEQVCSAVHEAHKQGIIHRDLKPDNIWLEPNQRGGYTVKVLDFGIAKLEENTAFEDSPTNLIADSETDRQTKIQTLPKNTFSDSVNSATIIEKSDSNTVFDNQISTLISESETIAENHAEAGTAILSNDTGEDKTAILSEGSSDETAILSEGSSDETAILGNKKTQISTSPELGTKLLTKAKETEKNLPEQPATADLTRVGAVLGTPLYMSPEQCRGEKLSPRSDIYSLGVITYQMLAGKTPFVGDFTQVMQGHKEVLPEILATKKVPRKVKTVIHKALAKNPEERPQTAESFASEIRSHSEGFAKLLQKALVIYSEHLPKLLLIAILVAIPHIFSSVVKISLGLMASLEVISLSTSAVLEGIIGVIDFFLRVFAAAFLVGMVTWLVAQLLAVPLRPVSIRAAFKHALARWKALGLSVTFSTLLALAGMACCFIPGMYWSTVYMLVAPVVMMENVSGKKAFRRSKELIKRSFLTALAIAFLIYLVPATVGGIVGVAASAISNRLEFYEKMEKGEAVQVKDEEGEDIDINFGPGGLKVKEKEKENEDENLLDEEKRQKKVDKKRRDTTTQTLLEMMLTPILILMSSLTSVITALMYFKTRQAGGESMQELLSQFEDLERPRSNWQNRIRERLEQSGRQTGKT